MQHTETYGLLRSPILANFQNVPNGLQQLLQTINITSIYFKECIFHYVIIII